MRITRLKRQNKEPIISPGGLGRLAVIILTIVAGHYIYRGVDRVFSVIDFREKPSQPLAISDETINELKSKSTEELWDMLRKCPSK